MNPNLDGYTFYVHNLGRFDSVFILKSLIINKNINITPIWKDNSILSLSIQYNNVFITLLDSLQLIPDSLDSILKSFKCNTKKGYFPYSFVNKNNLFYIGDKPSRDFYDNISDSEYNSIKNNNWDLKKETLNYLKSDVEGLLEAITKFSIKIYDKYQLNITNYKTLPGLALSVYKSSYIPDNYKKKIKMIKGEVENEIRKAYFAGNVDVFINKINKGYLYDINAQYPTAMLQDMPVGDPVLSLETNLDKIFGFVYAEITAPEAETLRVPFIQYRDPIKRLTTCPRGKFKRLIFSEEIKYALKFGYSINIEYCYQFERGVDLFKDYVIDHYKIRQSSDDPLQKAIAKLFLNSLYGRFGMKDLESIMKIVDKKRSRIFR